MNSCACTLGWRLPSPDVGRCVDVRVVARVCECVSLVGARVFVSVGLVAAQRAAAPAAWWASYIIQARVAVWFLGGVYCRPPGDFKTATNPHHIPIGPTPSDLGCVGPSSKKQAWKVNFKKKSSSACFTPSHGGTAVRRSSALGDFGTTRATRACAAPGNAPGNSPGFVWGFVWFYFASCPHARPFPWSARFV